MRNAAGEFDDIKAALHIAAGIRHHLAMLGRQQFRQFVHMLLDQRLEIEQHPGAALRVDQRPVRLRLFGGGDGRFQFGGAAKGDFRLHHAGIGVEHLAKARWRRQLRSASNQVSDRPHRLSPIENRRRGAPEHATPPCVSANPPGCKV